MQTKMKLAGPPIPQHGFRFSPAVEAELKMKAAAKPPTPPPSSGYDILAALAARLFKMDTEQNRDNIASIILLFYGEALPARSVKTFATYSREVKGHRYLYTPRLLGALSDLLADGDLDLAPLLREEHLHLFEAAERTCGESGIPADFDRRLKSLLGRL